MIKPYILLLSLALPTLLLAQPPTNDLCSSVTAVPLPLGSTLTFSGTRQGATSTNDGVPGNVLVSTFGVSSVWHAFTTTTCSDVTALYCNTPLPAQTTWSFITQDCPGDVPVYFSYANFGVLCPNGQFGIKWVNLPAGTYYMPIHGTAASGPYTITVNAEACTPGPSNDNCSGATMLPVNTSCLPVSGTVEHGTASIPALACSGNTGDANDDVWFAFIATGTTHTIKVQCNGDLDAVVELHSGECGNTAPIGCADATVGGGVENILATGLIPGNTYRVRVFHYYTALAATPTFTICVTGDVGTAIDEQEDSRFLVIPNPANDRITIQQSGIGSVHITDLSGRSVWNGQFSERTVVDVSSWPRGSYLVQLEGPRYKSTKRIVLY